MNILPFSKVTHSQLQLGVWLARFSFLAGICFLLAGTFQELFRIYRWLASPIYSEDGTSFTSYSYGLDLLHINWQLIWVGMVLLFVSSFLVIQISRCTDED